MEGSDRGSAARDYSAGGFGDVVIPDGSTARVRFDDTDMQVGVAIHSAVASVTSIRPRPDGSRPAMTRAEALGGDRPARDRADAGADVSADVSNGDILSLLRDYRAAETSSRREARREAAMGETDLLAMRLLVEAHAEGRVLTPGAIATALGISTASTTALIDRLSSAKFVERRPHETDRRSTVVVPTVRSEKEVREALGRGQASIARVADEMTQQEMEIVARFLTSLVEAVRDEPAAR